MYSFPAPSSQNRRYPCSGPSVSAGFSHRTSIWSVSILVALKLRGMLAENSAVVVHSMAVLLGPSWLSIEQEMIRTSYTELGSSGGLSASRVSGASCVFPMSPHPKDPSSWPGPRRERGRHRAGPGCGAGDQRGAPRLSRCARAVMCACARARVHASPKVPGHDGVEANHDVCRCRCMHPGRSHATQVTRTRRVASTRCTLHADMNMLPSPP